MNDFLIAMAPILGLWTLPVLPVIYAGFAATVEAVVGVVRSGLKASRNVERAIVKGHPFAQDDATAAQELSA